MTDIFIDPTKKAIAVRVESQSLHALGFEILIFANDANTILERFSGNTKDNNPFIKTLAKNPAEYKGNFISGTFTAIDPNGQDFTYTIEFSMMVDNVIIIPDITLSDTTTNGQDTISSVFHLN